MGSAPSQGDVKLSNRKADVVETSADKQPEEAHTLRNEALQLLRQAHPLYVELADVENANRMQSRIVKVRAQMFTSRKTSQICT